MEFTLFSKTDRQSRVANGLLQALATIAIALFATLASMHAQAQSIAEPVETVSDVLIVLDSDGLSHTVHHTIATTGPELTLKLPGSVIPQSVQFFGPERKSYQANYTADPSTLNISSGSAFARYQHQYGSEVNQLQPGYFELTTQSIPTNISQNTGTISQTSISWVLPSKYRLVSYAQSDYSIGRWESVNNTLSFYGSGDEPVELSITYKQNIDTPAVVIAKCNDVGLPSDECDDDKDADGIPDYRDVCADSTTATVNSLGCPESETMTLSNIEFETGKSYLDVTARSSLDTVAYAILNSDYAFFEISGHTDNEGETERNQRLSKRRADAVRHYLMLKGVGPNVIRSMGYGETRPIRGNDTEADRRANRRIDLTIIDAEKTD